MATLVSNASSLLAASISTATASQYARVWNQYQHFVNTTLRVPPFPASQSTLALYISHLVSPPRMAAPATVTSALSAIAFHHKIAGYEDPTATFFIRKLLKGLSNSYSTLEKRIPITPSILEVLLSAIPVAYPSRYKQALYAAMFATMFSAFLRIGEVTSSQHNLPFHQIELSDVAITITFYSYKHHTSSQPFRLTLPIAPGASACPVRRITHYIALRGTRQGPLFCDRDNSPVLPSVFREVLANVSRQAGVHRLHITPHSFRIGAATFAATQGYSSQQIQAMGRWKSTAFQKYVRVSSIQLPGTPQR